MKSNEKNGSGVDRRGFLKGFASAAVATGLVGPRQVLANGSHERQGRETFGEELLAPPIIGGKHRNERYWEKVAQEFGLADDYIHMNTGTTGSQPQFVQNNLAVYNRYKSADPRDWAANLNADFPDLFPIVPSATGARQAQVAAAYGADAGEIVLSYNTTDACNLIISGTPWEPGDRIVTTSFEHGCRLRSCAPWRAATAPIPSSTAPTAGACCRSTATPTGQTSSPAPATNGCAADPAPAFSMSATPMRRPIPCRPSRSVTSSLRSVTWRDGPASTADDRVGFRIATHGVYNNFDQIDHVFARLVDQVNLSGLPQLS